MHKFVELNGNKISVYSYGQGPVTVVLLSGSGVPFPDLEYRSVVKLLAENYQVIVIEKLGYGHSDLSENDRNIEVVVHEYKSVLQELGIETPVVLAAHSMGFLEALRWGQQYPTDVAGILGIDPATPECYIDFNIEGATDKLVEMSKDEQIKKAACNAMVEQLAEEHSILPIEKKELELLVYRNLANQNWISEAKNLRNSILLVEKDHPYLQIPMLFFISNGEGTTLDKDTWISHAKQYLNHIKSTQYELFDYPHNLYKFAYKEIAQMSKEFISKVVVVS